MRKKNAEKIIFAFLFMLMYVNCSTSMDYFSQFHPFKSLSAKQRYLGFYDNEAHKWPVLAETLTVSGQFGETFIRISGPIDAPPIVLIPGGSVSSLVWTSMVGNLSKQFRVYALDNIYDNGRSVYRRKMSKSDEFMIWLDETFDSLGLKNNISLVGYSYGGWIVARYALHAPNRVNRIALLAPACTVEPISPQFWFRVSLCMITSPVIHDSFEKWLFPWLLPDLFKKMADSNVKKPDEDETSIAFVSYKLKNAVLPPILTNKELVSFKVPVLYMFGEHEKVFSLTKAVKRLNEKVPETKIIIIRDAGHDLVLVQPEVVSEKISEFLLKKEI